MSALAAASGPNVTVRTYDFDDNDISGIEAGGICIWVEISGKYWVTAVPNLGYEFIGWTGSVASDDYLIKIKEDDAVTANFKQKERMYLLSLGTEGHGKLNIPFLSRYYPAGTKVNLLFAWADADKHYYFAGWRDNDNPSAPLLDRDTWVEMTRNRSFTAVFRGEMCDFSVESDGNGTVDTSQNGKKEYGTTVNLDDLLGDPNPGYKFKEWQEKSGTKWKTLTSSTVTIDTKNEFRAVFILEDYSVSYDGNGADGGTVPTDPKVYHYNDEVTVLPGEPEKTGYLFEGWQIDGSGTVYRAGRKFTMPAKNVTLVAKWKPISYTVVFHANDGSGSTESITVDYDQKFKLDNKFTRTGCTFVGWATSQDGPKVYDDGAEVEKLTTTNGATIDLYALWEVSGITVEGYNAPYDGEWHSVTVTGDLTGATVSYSTDGGPFSGEKPMFRDHTPGVTVTVKVERPGAAPYIGSATVVISKAELVVKAGNKSVVYGSDPPAYTYSFTGFVKGDNKRNAITGEPALSCDYKAGDPVDKYSIKVELGTLSAKNYYFTFVPGVLTVKKKALTVTADSISIVYGDDAPAYTYSITGFISGEDESVLSGAPKIVCSYVKGNDAGDYTIDIRKGTLAAANYSFTLVDGTLTVNKATLTVTADDKTVEYGQDPPAYTASISGFVLGQESSVISGEPALACDYAAGDDAKDYTITVSQGTLTAKNYDFSFVPGVLTVTPAPLTVKADDKTVKFLDPIPDYTVSYSGFVAGDTYSDLGGTLVYDCDYKPGSPVGTYTITPSGLVSGNYAITYVPGTLTVEDLILTVRFVDYDGTLLKSEQVVYGNAATAPTVTPPEGHHFVGWDKPFDKVTEDMTVTAQYAINTYTVRFFDYTGTVQIGETQIVNWGGAATPVTPPARTGFTFTGWTLTGDDDTVETSLDNVRENIDAVATYALNRFTVTFLNYDGSVLGTVRVPYGGAATAPEVPEREGYTFTGWDTPFDNVTSDLTVTALFRINTYTVTFMNYDGTVLSTQTVEWNTAATAPGVPEREGYTFIGWDKDFSAVKEDLTVTAQFVPVETVENEPVPGTGDDSVATLEDEPVPQQGPAPFPWWWIVIGVGAALLLFLLIFFFVKRRKREEQAAA